jgi:hypothetical protein
MISEKTNNFSAKKRKLKKKEYKTTNPKRGPPGVMWLMAGT